MKRKLKVPTFSGHKLDGWDNWNGLDISIENSRGTFRRGTDPDGNEWSRFMFHDYGYIKLTHGDHVDVYIGPDRLSEKVYVIHQLDPQTGAYDEDKCFIGFRRADDARRAFYWQYDHPTKFYGSMDTYDIDEFKQLLKDRVGVMLKKSLHKAKRMPVGTISKGRRKVAEGKWVPVSSKEAWKDVLDKVAGLTVKQYAAHNRGNRDEVIKYQDQARVAMEPVPVALKKPLWNAALQEAKEFMEEMDSDMSKAKRMPVGTVSKGRKKVAEGKWRPVKKGSSKKGLPNAEDLQVQSERSKVLSTLPTGETTAQKGTEYEKSGELSKTSYKVSGPIYRGVSLEDYKRIKKQGYVDTDMRGAISRDEGMNLAKDPRTALEYVPNDKQGVVLAIDPGKLKLWGIKSDDYIRTSDKIPGEAILGVSDIMDKKAEAKGFEISQAARKVAFHLAGYEMLNEAGYPKKAREWRERAKEGVKKRFPDDPEAQKAALQQGLKDKKSRSEYRQYIDLEDIVKKSMKLTMNTRGKK